jgi:hypothetical protein
MPPFDVMRGPRPPDAETPSLSAVLTSESDRDLARVCTDSPTSLEVSTYLGYCKVFIQLYSAIAVLATRVRTQGQKRATFSTLIVGLVGTGD